MLTLLDISAAGEKRMRSAGETMSAAGDRRMRSAGDSPEPQPGAKYDGRSAAGVAIVVAVERPQSLLLLLLLLLKPQLQPLLLLLLKLLLKPLLLLLVMPQAATAQPLTARARRPRFSYLIARAHL